MHFRISEFAARLNYWYLALIRTQQDVDSVSAESLMRSALIGLLAFALIPTVQADPRDFAVEVKPVFQSTYSWMGAPLAVEIENKGRDARGRLLSIDGNETTSYPVELPTGSKKRIVTFPRISVYGTSGDLFLDTNEGRFQIPYQSKSSYNYGNTAIIVYISDTAGDLGFLRQSIDKPEGAPGSPPDANSLFGDGYCKPEDAPTRPVGYRGIVAVVLGPGAERLSDGAVRALRLYALTGGNLIFIGGASATVLNDSRWSETLPGSNYRTATVAGSSVLENIGGNPIREAVTIASGSIKPGTKVKNDGRHAMIAERGFGLGRVSVFAFNPFEEPLARWSGRLRLFLQHARSVDARRAEGFLASMSGSDFRDPYGAPYSTTVYSGSYPPPGYNGQRDPFSVKLPEPSKVFWILAAFFAVVVPINFFILRKLGRGEWAWLTAPIISLSFAGIFLNQASDLYSASMSTATTGVLIVQDGMPESMFVGRSQMFFPNGGSYDLKLQSVDQLDSGENPYYGYGQSVSRSQVDPLDVGTIQIPNLRAANLAFEEIGFRQIFSEAPRLQVRATAIDNRKYRFVVENKSASEMTNSALVAFGTRYPLKPLRSGESQTMDISVGAAPDANRSEFIDGLTARQPVAIVVANLTGIDAGPQIGNLVATRSSTRLIYVASIPASGGLR